MADLNDVVEERELLIQGYEQEVERLKQELEASSEHTNRVSNQASSSATELADMRKELSLLKLQVDESRERESQLKVLLDEMVAKERVLIEEKRQLMLLKIQEGVDLDEISGALEDTKIDETTKKTLRVAKAKRVKNMHKVDARLHVLNKAYENLWEKAMSGYKWVHHLPQVSVKGKRYTSIEAWVRAEIAAQRKERLANEAKAHRIHRGKLMRGSTVASQNTYNPSRAAITGGLRSQRFNEEALQVLESSSKLTNSRWRLQGSRSTGDIHSAKDLDSEAGELGSPLVFKTVPAVRQVPDSNYGPHSTLKNLYSNAPEGLPAVAGRPALKSLGPGMLASHSRGGAGEPQASTVTLDSQSIFGNWGVSRPTQLASIDHYHGLLQGGHESGMGARAMDGFLHVKGSEGGRATKRAPKLPKYTPITVSDPMCAWGEDGSQCSNLSN
ncbi:unnamed protein product, partial [Chrysoparadoxa australica]